MLVIILHPDNTHTSALREIFEERGDFSRICFSWKEVKKQELNSASLIILDKYFIGNTPTELKQLLISKTIIFTDSTGLKDRIGVQFLGQRLFDLIHPPYNRFQIEQAIVKSMESYHVAAKDKPKRKGLFKIPLRFKISLPYLLLTFALGLFGAFIVTRVVFDTIEDRFKNQLLEAGKINHEWLVDKESSMLETVRYIANIEGIDQLIIADNGGIIEDYVYPIALNEELDAIRILGSDGEQIIGLDHKPQGNLEEYDFFNDPYDFSKFDVVKKIIDMQEDDMGNKYAGFYFSPTSKYFFIGGPIRSDDNSLVGVVLVGEYLDSMVADMRTSTLTQVSFYEFSGDVIASSFEIPNPLNTNLVANVVLSQEESTIRNFDVYDIAYGEVLSPLILRGREVVGVMGNALPKSFFLYSSFVTRLQVIVFIVTAIGLVIIIGVLISRFVSNPLVQLIEASKEVSQGNYSVSINAFTGDEIETLATTFNSMVTALQNSNNEILDAYDQSLDGWSRALELRDKETDYHCQRVADLAVKVAQKIDYPKEDIPTLRRGALLHDIGKMGISDTILLKPATLNKKEWEIMQKHTTYAMDLLKDIPFLHSAFEIPYCHHEKWDGSGYPNNLKEEEIPLSARIFAIVDIWDAMSSDRPYRKALDENTIIEYIQEQKGLHFDPLVVDAFLVVMNEEKQSENGKEQEI